MSHRHRQRFEDMVFEDNTAEWDMERRSFFFILSGNDELYSVKDKIYDCSRHRLKGTAFRNRGYLSSGTSNLLKLAVNLYNGHGFRNLDPYTVMVSLDRRNRRLVMDALKIRFSC